MTPPSGLPAAGTAWWPTISIRACPAWCNSLRNSAWPSMKPSLPPKPRTCSLPAGTAWWHIHRPRIPSSFPLTSPRKPSTPSSPTGTETSGLQPIPASFPWTGTSATARPSTDSPASTCWSIRTARVTGIPEAARSFSEASTDSPSSTSNRPAMIPVQTTHRTSTSPISSRTTSIRTSA